MPILFSRLPIAATETDRTRRCRLSPTDDDDFVHAFHSVAPAPDADTVHLIRSCGYTPIGPHALGARLGELRNAPPSNALGGLPPPSADFADFRDAGSRADTSEPMTPSSGWHIRGLPPTVVGNTSSAVLRNRPPVISTSAPMGLPSDVFVIEDTISGTVPPGRTRSTLDPRQVISTRTRRGSAAAAGQPLPAVGYFPPPEDSSVPTPPSAAAVRRPRRSTTPLVPVSPEPLVDAPTTPIGSNDPSTTPPSRPLLGSDPSPTPSPSIDDAALASAEPDFRESVERYSHADWAREQRNEPVSDAAIRYLLLGQPLELPSGFLDPYPTAYQPPFSDIRDLANKGRLYLDDDPTVLLVRKLLPRFHPVRPLGPPAVLNAFSTTNLFGYTSQC